VERAFMAVKRRAWIVKGTQRGKASRCKRNFLFIDPPSEHIA
jgi:hypothetical protein